MTSFELLALLNVVAARVRAEAVEAERRRIGAELHDQVGQDLTYALLALGRLERDLPDELRPRFDDAIAPIHAALSDVGRLAAGLRPAVLDELGLRAGLAALASEASKDAGLRVDTSLGDLAGLSADQQLAVYRVAQEAITNVVRHSGATRAWLSTGREDGQAMIRVGDNGNGIRQTPGLGLAGMAERAALAGGTLELSSGADGTTVTLRVPCASLLEETHDE